MIHFVASVFVLITAQFVQFIYRKVPIYTNRKKEDVTQIGLCNQWM